MVALVLKKLYLWVDKKPNHNLYILFLYTSTDFSHWVKIQKHYWLLSKKKKKGRCILLPFSSYLHLFFAVSISAFETYLVLFHCTLWWCHFPQHPPHLNLVSQMTTSAGTKRSAALPYHIVTFTTLSLISQFKLSLLWIKHFSSTDTLQR